MLMWQYINKSVRALDTRVQCRRVSDTPKYASPKILVTCRATMVARQPHMPSAFLVLIDRERLLVHCGIVAFR